MHSPIPYALFTAKFHEPHSPSSPHILSFPNLHDPHTSSLQNSKKKILLPMPLDLKLEPLRVKVYDEYCKAYCANCGVPTWCDAAVSLSITDI